jgi:hypothetical protein
MDCPGEALIDGGRPLSPPERVLTRARSLTRLLARRVGKAVRHPLSVPAKLRERAAARRRRAEPAPPVPAPLGLQAGDRVRVKSRDGIRATLDASGRCETLEYMAWVQDAFCGGTFTVRKRVDKFFDERQRRILRLRNVVILDGVYCEPDPNGTGSLAGCQKTCFLFWKEAWLERVP